MRPADLAYAVADRPPPLTCALNAVQHVIILSPALIYVLFVLNAAGATPEQMLRIISLSLVALGIAWALGMGLLGGLLPALRAARVPVTTALRAI